MPFPPDPARRRIAVLGLGAVGHLAAEAFGNAGFEVLGYDPDDRKRDAAAGIPGIQLALHWNAPEDVEAVLFCVGTPLRGAAPDPSSLLDAIRDVSLRHPPPLFVVESTVAPGFLETAVAPQLPPGTLLATAPERVDPGRVSPPYLEIPRMVGGVGEAATLAAVGLYRQAGFEVYPTTAKVAVYAKHLENAFRLVNIALLGEFAEVCAGDGVDIDSVVEGAATKPFGFLPFRAGPGAGGECVPVDPAYLAMYAASVGIPMPTVAAALASNRARPVRLAHSIVDRLPPEARRVLLVGVAYKAGTDDLRETPALPLADGLEAAGCTVEWWDARVATFRGAPPLPIPAWPGNVDAVVLLHPPPAEVGAWLAGADLPVFDTCGSLAGSTLDRRMRL